MNSNAVLEAILSELHLNTVREEYIRLAQEGKNPIDYLHDVMAAELAVRTEGRTKARLNAARFPVVKTFDTFDFRLLPNVPKMKILELTEKNFIEEGRNAVFYGPPGTGKTHCLIAIGVAACINGFSAHFTTAAGLLNTLLSAKRQGMIDRRLKALSRFDLLLIDELGYIPFEREATDLLFQVISQRYESKSVALTTNLAFEQWTQVFPDAMAATAVIDRIVHHGSVFEFAGESHRLRSRGGKTGRSPKT
jgi:DNA replication protein DnaC